jgi:cell wall-associated NlpC family hydrolase
MRQARNVDPDNDGIQEKAGWLARAKRSRHREEPRQRKRPGYSGEDSERSRGIFSRNSSSNKERERSPRIEESTGKPSKSPDASPNRKIKGTKASKKVLAEARSYLGTPYQWGGTSKRGMDCSGLMVQSFEAVGVDLPRTSSQQYHAGKPVSRKKIRPGDMVFFSYRRKKKVGHAGLVVEVKSGGDILFIHASSSQGVTISRLSSDYWSKRYKGARRILN